MRILFCCKYSHIILTEKKKKQFAVRQEQSDTKYKELHKEQVVYNIFKEYDKGFSRSLDFVHFSKYYLSGKITNL